MTDSKKDWLAWRALIAERLDLLADVLEFERSFSENLLEEAQWWLCASCGKADLSPTYMREVKPAAKEAPKSSPPISSSEPREVGMRSIDDIIADAQNSLGHSLREAFDAGRDHVASELRRRMASLFDELAGGGATGEHAQPATHEGHHSGQSQG